MRSGLMILACLLCAEAQAGVAVSPKPYVLCNFLGFPITNGMLYTWIISLAFIALVRWSVKTPQLVPTSGQVVVESLIETVQQLMAPIVGARVFRQVFPLLMGFFMYILIQNWSGLFPGVGTIGYYQHGHFTYFFRPSNADLNATLALAIVSMGAWAFFVWKCEGFKGAIVHIFGNKADKHEVSFVVYAFLFFVFFVM